MCVACIARLKAQIGSGGLTTVAFRIVFPVEDHFDFVYLLQCEGRHMAVELLLGRPRYPVDAARQGMGAIGLNGYIESCTMQFFHKCMFHLQGGLSACQHHETALAPRADGAHDVGYGHWLIGGMAGVAERASQVAGAEAGDT